MRHLGPALGLAILLAAPYARAEALIIDVAKKASRKGGTAGSAVRRTAEVKLVLSDSETSRALASELLKRLVDLGYDAAPAAGYGSLDEVDLKNTKTALRFELLRAGESCFINGKAVDSGAGASFWRWETSDDTQPCAAQLKLAIDAFAKARPPQNPKLALALAAADAASAADSPVVPLVLPASAQAPAPQAAPASDAAPVAARQQLPGAGPVAPPDPVEVPAFDEPEKKGCGCNSPGDPAGLAGLLLLSGALLRRRPGPRLK